MEMETMCRICMEAAKNPVNIYKTMALDDLVANLIIDCANIEVYLGDGCPEIVCTACLSGLEQAYSFQKLIKRSDGILKDLIDQVSESKQKIVEILEIERCSGENVKFEPMEEIITTDVKPNVSPNDDDLSEEEEKWPRWMFPAEKPITERPFHCCMCTETFESREIVHAHARDHHFIDPTKPLVKKERFKHSCTVCRAVAFGTATALENHLRSQIGILCTICGRPFNKATIHLHMRSHEREKLKATMPPTIPHSQKIVPCHLCGKNFKRSRLGPHLNKRHSEEEYECHYCGKKFKCKVYIYSHIRRHFPELAPVVYKNYHCSMCEKAFDTKAKLSIHFSVHTHERAFPCDFCDLHFKNPTDRRRHRWLKHIESPYTCQNCKKPFDRPKNLEKHEAICLVMV